MTYRIEIKSSAKKELAQLPREIGENVVREITTLQISCLSKRMKSPKISIAS